MNAARLGKKRGEQLSQVLMGLILILFAFCCLFPMYLVLINSFATEASILKNGYQLIPEQFSLEAYKSIFYAGSPTLKSYGITILITVVGTAIAVVITYMCGFSLANENLKYRNGFSLFFFITTVFNSGLVPWYLICRVLHLYNNIRALIIPSLIFTPFNMFLTRNFIKGVPSSLMDSARIDGAGELTIAFRIYFPICSPVIATITLFYALGYWNNWFNAIMLLDSSELYPLQMILFKIQSDLSMLKDLTNVGLSNTVPTESFKMASAIVTIGPIVLLYPFLQRYFTEGLIIGAVKG